MYDDDPSVLHEIISALAGKEDELEYHAIDEGAGWGVSDFDNVDSQQANATFPSAVTVKDWAGAPVPGFEK